MIIEAVLLPHERGKLVENDALGFIGEPAQVVEFSQERAYRTARFKCVQPEIFWPFKKRRELARVKFRDDG